eukprot:1186150-Prorocentrum_minimum.AAC.3
MEGMLKQMAKENFTRHLDDQEKVREFASLGCEFASLCCEFAFLGCEFAFLGCEFASLGCTL